LTFNAFLAILLAFFWGLRLSEIVYLRIGDLVLYSQWAYIHIRWAKGNKKRNVLIIFSFFHRLAPYQPVERGDLDQP